MTEPIPIHPFPARMAPDIALESLKRARKQGLRVLDPMMGSGTALVVARQGGHHAYGFDSDPLAVLLAATWCTPLEADVVRKKALTVLSKAKDHARGLDSASAYPAEANEETRKFIDFWFDDQARRQLTALSAEIGAISQRTVRNALWCAFSRLIITKASGASLAMDLSHSRPHKKFDKAPVLPFDGFTRAVERVLRGVSSAQAGVSGAPVTSLRQGDARKLPLAAGSIDLVITSPPYLNAIDYLRSSKFTLVWMGVQIERIRSIRGTNVGTESGIDLDAPKPWMTEALKLMGVTDELPRRFSRMAAKYVLDLDRVVGEIARVLVEGGEGTFVIGDSTLRGTFLENSAALASLAKRHGLEQATRTTREIPSTRRYLPTKTDSALGKRMRDEVVLTMKKVA